MVTAGVMLGRVLLVVIGALILVPHQPAR